MIKAVSPTGEVQLAMGTDYPIMMEFQLAEGNGSVKYLLAPRIEGD